MPGRATPYPRTTSKGRHEVPSIVSGVILSALLHGGIIVAALIVSWLSVPDEVEADEELAIVFDSVDLLALGEEKPPDALPRLANPEPAPPLPEDSINIARPEDAPKEEKPPEVDREKELERQREIERQRREEQTRREQEERDRRIREALSSLHNPNRPTNDDIPAGSAEGVAGGTVSDAALANLMGTYQVQLLSEITRYWEVPTTITSAELASLAGQVHVYVRVSETGHIVSFTFRSRSPNEQFNGSIERVLRRFQVQYGGRRLPLPEHPQVRQAVISRGLELKNWENVGR